MENLRKNKMLWCLVAAFCFNIFAFGGFYVLVEVTADRVIKKLERYSPSPYGPAALDPDKVNVNTLRKKVSSLENDTSLREVIRYTDVWRENWESERNSNP